MFDQKKLKAFNEERISEHQRKYNFLAEGLTRKGFDLDRMIDQMGAFQIAIPSWALGTEEHVLVDFRKGENLRVCKIKSKT